MHEKRDSKKAEAFKRDFLGILRRQPISGKRPIKIWFADESRYGLLPNLRRVCTLKGQQNPHKLWQSKYDWSYCYGSLDPVEGKTVFIQTPSVSLEWTRVFWSKLKLSILAMNLNSAVGRHIEMLSAVFGGAFACMFFNCGAVRLSHARTL